MIVVLLALGCRSSCETETIQYTETYTQEQLDAAFGGTNVDPSTLTCEELCDQDVGGDLSCSEAPVEGDIVAAVDCTIEDVVVAC